MLQNIQLLQVSQEKNTDSFSNHIINCILTDYKILKYHL